MMAKGFEISALATPAARGALVALLEAAAAVFGPLGLEQAVTVEPLYKGDSKVRCSVETEPGTWVSREIRVASVPGGIVRISQGRRPFRVAESLEAALRLIVPPHQILEGEAAIEAAAAAGEDARLGFFNPEENRWFFLVKGDNAEVDLKHYKCSRDGLRFVRFL